MACACSDEGGHQVYTSCAGQDGGNNVQAFGHSYCCNGRRISVEDVCADNCLESDSHCGNKRSDDNYDDFKYGSEDLRNVSSMEINESQILREFYTCNTEGNGGMVPVGANHGEGKNEACLGGAGTCVAHHRLTTEGTCCYFGDCHGGDRIDVGDGPVKADFDRKQMNESHLLNEERSCREQWGGCMDSIGHVSRGRRICDDDWCSCIGGGGGCTGMVRPTLDDRTQIRESEKYMKTMKINESELRNIIKRTLNETQLLLERPGCSDDDECASNAVCATAARDGDGACVPICRKGRKGAGCKPLSVANDSPKKEIDERGRRGGDMDPPVGGKWYCVMEGHPCWELDERDRSAKGNKGYRSERKCNKKC